jgi:RNA polymerase sigma factor (sigma-70 family)
MWSSRLEGGAAIMDVAVLVTRARSGDVDAFTELVRSYQAMALGYAYSSLGDFQVAEDIVQQAFVVAYRNLSRLEKPERFGGWLRGIVRFECSHYIRKRRLVQVPIDAASGVASPGPEPAEIAEQQESFERVLEAVRTLPPAEREVTVLFYIHDHSQRDIAAFLDLPVSTVNNRLRAARTHLRQGGLLGMTRDAFREHELSNDFAARVGEVVSAQGPIVDVRFAPGEQPAILSALSISNGDPSFSVDADVAQLLDDGLVRCIARAIGDLDTVALRSGMRVTDTAIPATVPLDFESIRKVISELRQTGAERGLMETGIKAIDVCCPLPAGGLVGIVGDSESGKVVLVDELVHRLAARPESLTLMVFVEAQTEVSMVRNVDYQTSTIVQAIFLPVADASPDALASVTDGLDAVVAISRDLAGERLYPAIDPRRSRSRLLDPAVIGQEHYDVAARLRRLLEDSSTSPTDDRPSGAGRRRDLIRNFLTQPFFVAEPFTNRAGKVVSRDAAVADCAALLDGTQDDTSPDSLYMIGSLDEATA